MNDFNLEEIPEVLIEMGPFSPSGKILSWHTVHYSHEERVAMKLEMEEHKFDFAHNEALAETADRDLQSGRTRICPKCLGLSVATRATAPGRGGEMIRPEGRDER